MAVSTEFPSGTHHLFTHPWVTLSWYKPWGFPFLWATQCIPLGAPKGHGVSNELPHWISYQLSTTHATGKIWTTWCIDGSLHGTVHGVSMGCHMKVIMKIYYGIPHGRFRFKEGAKLFFFDSPWTKGPRWHRRAPWNNPWRTSWCTMD